MSIPLQPRRSLVVERGQDPAPGASFLPATEDVETAPPRPFEFTRYSLYIILVTFGFALSKAVYAYMGDSVVPTTLEFVFGGVFTIGMYWISLYEPVRPKRFKPFLHDPLNLWSAVRESIVAYLSAGHIYCSVRLMRESWGPPGKPPLVLTYFLFLGLAAVVAYILHWERLGVLAHVGPKNHRARFWWYFIICTMIAVLTFIPAWKHLDGGVMAFMGDRDSVAALFTTLLLLDIVETGQLYFILRSTASSRTSLRSYLRPFAVQGFIISLMLCCLGFVFTYPAYAASSPFIGEISVHTFVLRL